jgi:hypothetical protein
MDHKHQIRKWDRLVEKKNNFSSKKMCMLIICIQIIKINKLNRIKIHSLCLDSKINIC